MATYTIANAVEQVWRTLRDTGDTADKQLLTNTEITAFLAQALRIHSLRFPAKVAVDLTADGTTRTALPVSWEPGLSNIVMMESPVGTVIDSRLAYIYTAPTTGSEILWRSNPPPVGTVIRLLYTGSVVVGTLAANTTLPDVHFYPVCDLASSLCADSLAAKYASTSEPAIGIDIANYRSKSQEWIGISRRLEDRYRTAMGLGASSSTSGGGTSSGVIGASATVNWDTRPGHGGDYIIHRRSTR